MSGDYLWDRSGDPDPDVRRLERLLSEYKHSAIEPTENRPKRFQARVRSLRIRFAIAAVVTLGLCTFLYFQGPDSASDSWIVESVSGERRDALVVGQWLETGAGERVRIQVADIGSVDVEPGSKLMLVETGHERHRMSLARGEIEAFVTAPPRLFMVETPAATAVDLGCKYKLSVEDDGSGMLSVSLGYVQLEEGDSVSFVPRGARCSMTPRGPGIPYFDDAPAGLVDIDAASDEHLGRALASAERARDTLTLWHLLLQCESRRREAVLERIVELVELEPRDRSGLLSLQTESRSDYFERLKTRW